MPPAMSAIPPNTSKRCVLMEKPAETTLCMIVVAIQFKLPSVLGLDG